MACTGASDSASDDSPDAGADDDDDAIDSDDAASAKASLRALRAQRKRKRRQIQHKICNPGNKRGNRAGMWQHTRCDFSLRFDQWDPGLFQRFYRLRKETFARLVELLGPAIQRDEHRAKCSTAAGAISPELHVAVTLRWLAGGSYLDIANGHGVCIGAFWGALHRTLDAIDACPELEMRFPVSEEELAAAAKKFEAKSEQQSFTDVVAAIDGILVGIVCPSSKEVPNPGRYWTRKNKYALNVQAAAGANWVFSYVSIVSLGSVHDGIAWQLSTLGAYLKDGKLPAPYFVVGDAAYSGSPSVLVPIAGSNLEAAPDSFNFHLSQLRINVECAFGMLVQRWGIFWRPLRCKFDRLAVVVTCAMKLHNLCVCRADDCEGLDEDCEVGGQAAGRAAPERDENGGMPGLQRGDGPRAPIAANMERVREELVQLMRDLRMPRPLVRRF